MAGVFLKASFSGQKGTDWTLDIYDNDYTGSVYDLNINGFSLERSEPLSNRVSPVLGSEVTVNMIVDSAAAEAFLTAATTADEDRYFLNLYKDGNLHWSGVLLLDLIDLQDLSKEARQQVALRFTDGIARLKTIDYNNSGAAYSGEETMIEHINNIISKIPTQQFWTGSDIHLKTSCHYFDTAMTYSSSTDPLEFIRVNHKAFYTLKQNGEIQYMSCYDVLVQLMSNFYQRFWLGDGSFNAVQVDEFRNASIKLFHYINGGTSHTATSTISPRVTVDQTKAGAARLRGGTYNRYAGLKSVKCKYIHNSSGNFLPQPLVLNASASTLGSIDDNGGDARIVVKGVLNLIIENTNAYSVKINPKLLLKQGSKYLKRTASTAGGNNNYNNLQWSGTSTDRVEFWTGEIIPTNLGLVNSVSVAIQVDFTTPYLVNDGDLEMQLVANLMTDIYDLSNNLVTSNVSINGDFVGYVEYKTDSTAENERLFDADNTGLGNYSQVLELPDAVFGDAINSSTINRLEVYNGSNWVNASSWKKKNIGTGMAFHTLLCDDILAGQRTAIKKYRGNVRGDITFMNTLLFASGDVFGLLGGSFNGKTETWEGLELVRINYDNSNITNTTTGQNIEVDVPPSLNTNGGNQTIFDETVEIVGNSAKISDADGNVNISGNTIGGSYNVNIGGGIGSSATGNYNFFSLLSAGISITSGKSNIGIGLNALKFLTTGEGNLSLGHRVGEGLTIGNYNVFLGYNTGFNVTTGSNNVFIGRNAGNGITTSSESVVIGYNAGLLGNGNRNVFIGINAGRSTSGSYNFFGGYNTGYSNTTGDFNFFIGLNAGYLNTTGSYNNFIGRDSGRNNLTGSGNNFLGYQVGYNATGNYNNVLGYQAESNSYNYCFVVGRGATATANNQVVFGSATYNLGTVRSESLSSTKTWEVMINGTLEKILLE